MCVCARTYTMDVYVKWARWAACFANGILAVTMILVFSINASPCRVVYSFRQELTNTIVANPFYASSGMLGNRIGNSSLQKTAKDIFVFPNFVKFEMDHAGFLPVRADQQTAPLNTSMAMSFPYRYGNDVPFKYIAKMINDIMPEFRESDAPIVVNTKIYEFALESVARPYSVGSHVPNVFRCIKDMVKDVAGEKPTSKDYEEALKKLKENSGMLGACLLSGLQQTVDVTSNYKTSPVPFSSVNPLFFITLACWIAASFSVVGFPLDHEQEKKGFPLDHEQEKNDKKKTDNEEKIEFKSVKEQLYEIFNIGDFYNGIDKWDRLFIASLIWNLFGIISLCIPDVREKLNIPVNNAAIGVALLLVTIAVQAYVGSIKYEDTKEQNVTDNTKSLNKAENQTAENLTPTVPPNVPPNLPEAMMCSPSLFFSTLSRSSSNSLAAPLLYAGGDVENAPRARKVSSGAGPGAIRRGWQPSYDHRAVRTGQQLVRPNFMEDSIRSAAHPGMREALQHLEFALWVPLLYTSVLCAGFPGMPTAFVQILFMLMLVSHMIAAPLVSMLPGPDQDARNVFNSLTVDGKNKLYFDVQVLMQRTPLLVAFFLMQGFCMASLNIMLSYNTGLSPLFQSAKISIIIVQALFAALLLFLSLYLGKSNHKLFKKDNTLDVNISDGFAVLGFIMRIVLVCLILAGGIEKKQDSIFSCEKKQ